MSDSVRGSIVLDLLRTPWRDAHGITYCHAIVLLSSGACIQLDGDKDYYWDSVGAFCTEMGVPVEPYELSNDERESIRNRRIVDVVHSEQWAFFSVGVVLENEKVIFFSDLGPGAIGVLVTDITNWRDNVISYLGRKT